MEKRPCPARGGTGGTVLTHVPGDSRRLGVRAPHRQVDGYGRAPLEKEVIDLQLHLQEDN